MVSTSTHVSVLVVIRDNIVELILMNASHLHVKTMDGVIIQMALSIATVQRQDLVVANVRQVRFIQYPVYCLIRFPQFEVTHHYQDTYVHLSGVYLPSAKCANNTPQRQNVLKRYA